MNYMLEVSTYLQVSTHHSTERFGLLLVMVDYIFFSNSIIEYTNFFLQERKTFD